MLNICEVATSLPHKRAIIIFEDHVAILLQGEGCPFGMDRAVAICTPHDGFVCRLGVPYRKCEGVGVDAVEAAGEGAIR